MESAVNFLNNADIDLFLFFNKYHNSFFDVLMFNISKKYIWLPLYAFALFLLIKKYKIKKALLILAFFILLIVLSDQTSVHLFKNVFQRLRPCYNPDIEMMVHTINLPGSRYGFVSSHAGNAFAFAFLSLLLIKNRNYSIAILVWASIVSYSRIYLGVHYPGDIIGGAVLGIILSIIIYIIIKNSILKSN